MKDVTPKRRNFDNRPTPQNLLISKIVKDPYVGRTYDRNGNRTAPLPPAGILNSVSQRTAGVINDIASMMQLLPDIELAAQILVSSILSPKDMGAPNLNFLINSQFTDTELAGKLIKVVDEYFTDDYKINDELPEILVASLIRRGSCAKLIVPESSLDALINNQGRLTLESVTPYVQNDLTVRPLGLLSHPVKGGEAAERVSLESILSLPTPSSPALGTDKIHDYLSITDNPDALKVPKMLDRIRQDKVKMAMASNFATLESLKEKRSSKRRKIKGEGMSDRELERLLEEKRRYEAEPLLELKTKEDAGRPTYGHPMVVELPSEAVIPAFVPGNPSKHIAYFVLVDMYGNPVSTADMTDHYRYLQESFEKGSESRNQINTVLNELQGNRSQHGGENKVEDVMQATRVFADIIERNLLERWRKGFGHSDVELGYSNEVYQIMLSRICQRKQTQILYVPAELMSYFAFYHNANGVGKSLLEESRVIGGIRVLIMFANTLGAVRNSTPRTELNIEFDPNDSDPISTASMVKDAFMRLRAESYPLGEGDPAALIRYLQNASVDVVYSGHDALPDMKVTTADNTTSRALVDSELEDKYRRQHIMAMGISPETVDASAGVDFATTLVNSSLLLSKRVALYQKQFESMLADFVRKYVTNSETLLSELMEVIMEHGNKEAKADPEATVEAFIDSIDTELPKPDTVTLESQMQAFNAYSGYLDEAINAWVTDEIALMDVEGDIAQYLGPVRAAIKAMYQRRWLRENNVFPELEEITDTDEKGKPLFNFKELQGKHFESIWAFIEDYIRDAREAAMKRDKRLTEEQEKLEQKINGGDEAGGGDEYAGGDEYNTDQADAGDDNEPGAEDTATDEEGTDEEETSPSEEDEEASTTEEPADEVEEEEEEDDNL